MHVIFHHLIKERGEKSPTYVTGKDLKNIVFGWALNLAQTLMFMKSSLQTAVILFFCFYCGLRYNDASCSDRWWHIWSDTVVYWLCFIFIQTSAIAFFFHALCDIIIPPDCVVHVWSPRTNLHCLIVQSFECGGSVKQETKMVQAAGWKDSDFEAGVQPRHRWHEKSLCEFKLSVVLNNWFTKLCTHSSTLAFEYL